MKNLCTIADNNFTEKVLALNSSLERHQKDYILHLLCVDDQIYNRCNHPNIKKYKLQDLIGKDKSLERSISNPPSREALLNTGNNFEAAQRLQFLWSLSPYFTWWCIDNLDIEDVLYVDSDIYFYKSLEDIYESVEGHNIGLVEHRCPYNPVNGKYNVGIVFFRNNFDSYKTLTWWKNCLLKPDNEYAETHGTCGDQKYLEVFESLSDSVKILDEDIGHLAPWNFNFHQYVDNKIVWNNMKQEVTYCHFSNFKPNYESATYELAPRHGFSGTYTYGKENNHYIKLLADQYYNDLREAHEKT